MAKTIAQHIMDAHQAREDAEVTRAIQDIAHEF